jgi:hypothetical protein
MIHIDRLHRAICRLTGVPFCHVTVREVVGGTMAHQVRSHEIRVRFAEWMILDRLDLRQAVAEIKRDHGWDSKSQSSQPPLSRPACTSGGKCTTAEARRLLQSEGRSRART